MSAGVRPLTAKQARFVAEYLVDLNATQAAIRAGYSPKAANRNGPRMLSSAGIRAAVDEALLARREHTELSEAWTLGRLRVVVDRCMEATPVLDSSGKPTGVYRFNATGACRALELIGRHFGMFLDRVRLDEAQQMTDEELAAAIRASLKKFPDLLN